MSGRERISISLNHTDVVSCLVPVTPSGRSKAERGWPGQAQPRLP